EGPELPLGPEPDAAVAVDRTELDVGDLRCRDRHLAAPTVDQREHVDGAAQRRLDGLFDRLALAVVELEIELAGSLGDTDSNVHAHEATWAAGRFSRTRRLHRGGADRVAVRAAGRGLDVEVVDRRIEHAEHAP